MLQYLLWSGSHIQSWGEGIGNLWKMSQGKMEAWIYSTA